MLALASEIDYASVLEDAKVLAYISLRSIGFISWAYLPSYMGTLGLIDRYLWA